MPNCSLLEVSEIFRVFDSAEDLESALEVLFFVFEFAFFTVDPVDGKVFHKDLSDVLEGFLEFGNLWAVFILDKKNALESCHACQG